ncbi:MAG: PQQ-binding-like beta-propeller repeat protein, partial [Gemmataceae bacterium]|nr:PQQ-binding-like beta-propeller repeat protein [Gemmataceae bacterium]
GPARVDRAGDSLPPGALARFGSARFVHGGGITGLGFSPDGKVLVSATGGDTPGLRAWDPATGKELARLDRFVQTATFGPNGTVVAADGGRGFVWTPSTGGVRELPDGAMPPATTALAVHPDGRTVAAAAAAGVVLFDGPTGRARAALKLPPPGDKPPLRVVFSPDGRWLAAAGDKTGVWLWDRRTNRRVRTYPAAVDRPDFAFAPDGGRIAVAANDVRVYPTDAEEPDDGFTPVEGAAADVRFSADAKAVFALRPDGAVVRADAATGKVLDTWPPPATDFVPPAALAPGGRLAALTDARDRIRVWEPATGKGPIAEQFLPLSDPGFTADGKAVTGIDPTGVVRSFDPATGAPGKTYTLNDPEPQAVAWHAGSGRAVLVASGETEARVVEAATGKELARVRIGGPGSAPTAVFSPTDPDRFAVLADGVASVCDVTTGRVVRSLPLGRDNDIYSGAFSPDGRLFAATTEPLSVWEVETGRRRFEVAAVGDPDGVVFSRDGRLLAAWDGGDLAVFDVRAGSVVRRVRHPAASGMHRAAAFSPDGARLAAGGDDGLVVVWDVATGAAVYGLERHEGSVDGLAWAADGKTLVSTGDDGTALVWDVSAPPAAGVELAGVDDAIALLGAADPGDAQRGMAYLYARPAEAARRLGEAVPVPAAVPADRLAKLVADLASDDFRTRQAAVRELEGVGRQALPAVRAAAGKPATPEAGKLAAGLAARFDGPPTRPDDLRAVRAVEVLEGVGSPAAREVLAKWAAGPPADRLTVEAAAAVKRLSGAW